MGIICKISGYKCHKPPNGSVGCSCKRCGKSNPNWHAKHDWKEPMPISDPNMTRYARL